MKYKINHEGLLYMTVSGAITVAVFIISALLVRSLDVLFAIVVCCNIVDWSLFFLNRAIGLSITIDEKTVLIKGMFVRKTIRIADIYDVSIEHYERRLRSGLFARTYHRMRMKISLVPDKTFILDDNATVKKEMGWEIDITSERKPDEEVALYQVYQQLSVKRDGSF